MKGLSPDESGSYSGARVVHVSWNVRSRLRGPARFHRLRPNAGVRRTSPWRAVRLTMMFLQSVNNIHTHENFVSMYNSPDVPSASPLDAASPFGLLSGGRYYRAKAVGENNAGQGRFW
ncbi:hypothetical protein ACCAA_580014 [Candidatus Accumulibacter aalborgensis]|uniref:Uncharacterized protein n=1 Tax=Candidatus Accumulibacter aalborgensis TaxID=1860102 RepID=A0A1A8XVA5_9PROT|nr:hypothetical protein ACCAA_580014 [Candidatus Accumulibacter aalborgensis]